MLRSIKRWLRSLEQSVRESRLFLSAGFTIDRIIVRFAASREGADDSGFDLLLPTAGRGNIGDQAMFESFVQNTTGPLVVLVRDRGDFQLAEAGDRDVTFISVPKLVGASRFGRKRDVVAFARALARARTFSIVGADVMDGGYQRSEAVRRAQLLRLAAERGVPSRVLGFSWNAHSDVVARRELRKAARASALFARDPHSHARLTSEQISAHHAADIVFRLELEGAPHDLESWIQQDERAVVTVNVSGLILRKKDLGPEFADVVKFLTQSGHRVLLLPHVVRPGDNDLDACRRVLELLDDATQVDVHLVERVLSPTEVAWIAERSAAVLTGRMHLAILSLGRGTVPITLATQGKVEGLAELFGIEDLVLSPEAGIGSRAIEKLREVLSSDDYQSRVARALPGVQDLASRSFDGLSRPN